MTYLALFLFFAVAASVGVLVERYLSREDRRSAALRAANRDGKGEGR